MKFKKDGNVFEDIRGAWFAWECPNKSCMGRPGEECDLFNTVCQIDWCELHPAEAARLMGYEVVEDEPDNCGKCEFEGADPRNPDSPCCACDRESMFEEKAPNIDKQKPRICEVLGVEVDERFTYPGMNCEFFVNDEGYLSCTNIEHPFAWCCETSVYMSVVINHPDNIIRKPRFTEEEVADARAIMRLFPIAKDIIRDGAGLKIYQNDCTTKWINPDLFPSIRPGQSVKLIEIVGGDA